MTRNISKFRGICVAAMMMATVMLAAMPTVRAEGVPLVFSGICDEGAYTIALIPSGEGYVVHGVVISKTVGDIINSPLPSLGDTYVEVGPIKPGEWHNFSLIIGGERTGVGANIGSRYVHIYSNEVSKPIDKNVSCPWLYKTQIWGLSWQKPTQGLVETAKEILDNIGKATLNVDENGGGAQLDNWILVIG
ncbi:MAG: hypothetical protein CVT47_01675 [Thermoplasmata archaeon HGW-Thermoplasmata-2]|nr:MAG: hypothetical protein CVT47_01675 [Thermoplasmata archaeon HGW-Thermoplasmata-2]